MTVNLNSCHDLQAYRGMQSEYSNVIKIYNLILFKDYDKFSFIRKYWKFL